MIAGIKHPRERELHPHAFDPAMREPWGEAGLPRRLSGCRGGPRALLGPAGRGRDGVAPRGFASSQRGSCGARRAGKARLLFRNPL